MHSGPLLNELDDRQTQPPRLLLLEDKLDSLEKLELLEERQTQPPRLLLEELEERQTQPPRLLLEV